MTFGPYWYHHDGLGSVVDITSASGTPLAWAEYTPYGAVLEEQPKRGTQM